MKLTKDECRLLGAILDDGKHYFCSIGNNVPKSTFQVILELEKKLELASEDKRRQGRTSQNDFSDLIKRMVKKDQDGK